MTTQLKKFVGYSISIALGVCLFYLAMRDVDTSELLAALKNAAYGWLIPIVATIFIGHGLRAWRWQILIEALPDHQRTGELNTISFKNTFMALLIGYFANILVPRLGEFARAASLSKQEGIRFSGVFGTVVAERVFDVIVLLLGIASLSVLFYDQFLFLQDRVLLPLLSLSQDISIGWTAFGLAGFTAVGYITLRSMKASQSSKLMQFRRRLISVIKSFKDGLFTLLTAPKRVILIVSTILMWLSYAAMAYLMFIMLDMDSNYDLGFAAAWSIMIFGAIGFAVPSPAGTGSFHYFTILALVNLYFIDDPTAAAYALLSHGLHVLVYIIAGIAALFIQGTNLKSLQATPIDTD